MPTPIAFDVGGTPAYRANLQTWRANPAPQFPIWRFLLAVAALPPLLAFLAGASWLSWMCFQGIVGPPAAIIALVGIAALAALIRRQRAWPLVPRYRSSRWWGWLGWCGLCSRCWRWRWLRGCDGIGGMNAASPAIRANSGRLETPRCAVPRQMVRSDPRHQFIALPEPLEAVESQREGEHAIKVVEDGGL